MSGFAKGKGFVVGVSPFALAYARRAKDSTYCTGALNVANPPRTNPLNKPYKESLTPPFSLTESLSEAISSLLFCNCAIPSADARSCIPGVVEFIPIAAELTIVSNDKPGIFFVRSAMLSEIIFPVVGSRRVLNSSKAILLTSDVDRRGIELYATSGIS